MKFNELTECPYCGCDEFYSTAYLYGTTHYAQRFDGEETDNEDLYGSLHNRPISGRAYCRACEKYLGNMLKNTVGIKAAEAWNRRTSDET